LVRWLPIGALTAALALGAALAPKAALAASARAASAKDEGAVKQLFDDFRSALNSHDAHAVAALCTEDVDFIVIGGEDIRGRNAVIEHLQPLFNGRLKTMDRSAEVQEVRFLRPDVAIVVGNYESRGVTRPDGSAVPPAKGVYDWVVVRRAGQWRIALWHEANLPAPAPPRP
jgi:uncharacterized protein (TIGR02246 family)